MNGFILVDKDKEMTSFDVIRKFKKQFKGIKFGHTGTLDPDTTGLLVIASGNATKFIELLTNDSFKTYVACMQFGKATDSLDHTGNVIKEDNGFQIDAINLREVINSFIGEYEQIPPQLSAKKVNGKRAYDSFFEGEEVALKPKSVEVFNIQIENIDFENKNVTFKATVSKGTYIRSLIRDIAEKLNTCAYMSSLRRTQTDGFIVDKAINISDLETSEKIKSEIIDLKDFLKDNIKGQVICNDKLLHLAKNGVRINNQFLIEKILDEAQAKVQVNEENNSNKENNDNKATFILGENKYFTNKFAKYILLKDTKGNVVAIYEKISSKKEEVILQQVMNLWSLNDL